MNEFIKNTWAFWGLLGIAILLTAITIIPAFAQQEIEEEMMGFIEEGVDDAVDQLTDNLDFSQNNPLNTTKEETDALKDSGQTMLGETIDLIEASHHFSEDLIIFLSPYDVPTIVLFLVAGAIAFIFFLSIMKRLAIHLVLFMVVTLIVVGLLVWLYY